jgi:general secretion pathway protein J
MTRRYRACSFVSSSPRCRSESGFTLVEVMVSLTILSLIMLATITAFRTLGNSRVVIDRMTGRVDEVRAVSGFLRDAIESAVILGDPDELTTGGGPSESTYFALNSTSLEWQTTILFGETFGGSYFLKVGQEGGQLVLRWQEITRFGSPEKWEDKPSRLLVSDVDHFKVAYRRGFSGNWLEEWDRGEVPDFVRLQIAASGRYWPDLIMRVQR